ncbi:MAG: thioredoxin family protein [Flavobacterium sp.]
MKKIVILAFLIIGTFAVEAQELKWHTDVKEAIATGAKEKKPLLLFFTGSDWCGWCIRLQKEVFVTPEFTKWAKEKVVLVELDFPRSVPQSSELKMQNKGMEHAFSIQGYPTVWLATAEFKEGKPSFGGLGKTGYVPGGPEAWLQVANGILSQK